MRELPFRVKRGVASWTVEGPRPRVAALLTALARRRLNMKVRSLRPGGTLTPSALLTARQDELFRRAVRSGYYEVPRRISLSQLARRAGVAVSTLSVTLAIAERKLLTGR